MYLCYKQDLHLCLADNVTQRTPISVAFMIQDLALLSEGDGQIGLHERIVGCSPQSALVARHRLRQAAAILVQHAQVAVRLSIPGLARNCLPVVPCRRLCLHVQHGVSSSQL